MAGSIDLDWSDDALTDLDRFAAFLQEQSAELAAIVAEEIIARAQLTRMPLQGARQVFQDVLHGEPNYATARVGMAVACFLKFELTCVDLTPDSATLQLAEHHTREASRLDHLPLRSARSDWRPFTL